MIRKILSPLGDIIQDKPYVETYGGLAQQAVSIEETESGLFSEAVFPVSMKTTGEQCMSGNFLDLVPDSNKKSIFYFEGLTDMVFEDGPGQNSARPRNEGRVGLVDYRLVGWLNLPKLGEEDVVSHKIVSDLISVIHGYKAVDPQGLPIVSQIRYKVIKQISRDVKIFERYSYHTKMNLLLYPFDFFALVIRAQATLKGGECYGYEPGNEVVCF